ncbi:unnamed protein product [Peronospora belbahrii]|uniref:Uncharacterized protein n=1 Tax=Peronospora belbahrii TaxID=622444 RepID=A0ABN8D5H6_9STRA|nr:unnamed protein product [Peronospora belbahrii]
MSCLRCHLLLVVAKPVDEPMLNGFYAVIEHCASSKLMDREVACWIVPCSFRLQELQAATPNEGQKRGEITDHEASPDFGWPDRVPSLRQ